ncbi:MAG: GTPase HflX [bacterium]
MSDHASSTPPAAKRHTHGTVITLSPVPPMRALLVGVHDLNADPEHARELIEELSELTRTQGMAVAGQLLVRLREPQTRYWVGSGKANEIVAQARAAEANVIIFDDSLTPAQQRNWEKLAGLPVIDREEVILDIFAKRARTREAILQVALARAQYDLPRLKRRWLHLSRQRGARGGMGGRGEGEQQIEVDARLVKRQIVQLRQELATVSRHRAVQRRLRQRRALPLAAIVGYTNVGKSCLLNRLTQADVLVEDKLFATLDPTVRRLRLARRQELLVADTVGFIRKLPHQLVEAFKSTLEEVANADFLLEVLDITNPEVEEHHDTTVAVLREIGAEKRPVITVFNKTDLLTDPLARQRLRRRFRDAMFISACTGDGFDALLERLAAQVAQGRRRLELLLPHTRGDLLAQLHRACRVLEENFTAAGAEISAEVPLSMRSAFEPFLRPATSAGTAPEADKNTES